MHNRPQPFGRGLVIICNFLSSSVGFNLCSCFFRLTPVVRFRFQPLWAVRSTTFAASLPLSDPLCFGILSSASVLGSDYSASVLPFLLFPSPPHSSFLGAPSPLSLPWLSPFSPTRFPVSSVSVLRTRLPVCFLSSLPVSPHSRSTGASLPFSLPVFSTSDPLPFVRFSSGSGYSAFRLSFPLFPFSPVGGSYGASFLFRSACFHAVLPISVLGSLQFLSTFVVSPHSGYPDASTSSFRFRPLPLAFALGSVTRFKCPLCDNQYINIPPTPKREIIAVVL